MPIINNIIVVFIVEMLASMVKEHGAKQQIRKEMQG